MLLLFARFLLHIITLPTLLTSDGLTSRLPALVFTSILPEGMPVRSFSLFAHETTKVAAGSTWYVGTSGTACSGTSDKIFSDGKRGRLKIKQAKYAKGKAQTAIGRCTSSTRLLSISMLGPFETARFKTSDQRVYVAMGKTGSTAARVAAILLP
jgi:hypothetical protein